MKIKFKDALERLGGVCPVCGNKDHKNITIGSKKFAAKIEQIYFFCLDCGTEISTESGKLCLAYISRTVNAVTQEIKYAAKIEFKDLGSFISLGDSGENEARSVLKVLGAWNIPLFGPPQVTAND